MGGCVMSVFGLVPQRIGGMEMFARELSSQLAAAGWKSVLCFTDEPVEAVRRFLEAPNVVIEVAPDSAHLNWAGLRHVAALLRRHRPDVLHLTFADLASLYPCLARCCSVRRILVTDQNSRVGDNHTARSPAWKRAIRQALNWPVNKVIAVSDYVARYDEALGLARKEKIARIYNGVDLRRASGDGALFRRRYSIPENRHIVLQVSWIIPEKGVLDLLDAARATLASKCNAHFIIAGEGAHRAQYMEYAVQAGIADRITWTGLLEDPLAGGVYAAADVVCLLSRWQEAFGWVIAEAMACRKPLVATNVGGIPEIVEDGVTGFLVPPRRPDAAAQRIVDLLADASLRRRMGDAGRARVERLFNLRNTVTELMDLYGIPVVARSGGPG